MFDLNIIKNSRAKYLFERSAGVVGLSLAQRAILKATRRARPVATNVVFNLRKRVFKLMLTDFRNAKQGVYAKEALFPAPWRRYGKDVMAIGKEIVRSELRRRREGFDEVPAVAKRKAFPNYYQRNFHWQSDGYFSERSAHLYEPGVEFLFVGMADAMRRQVLPPIAKWLKAHPQVSSPKIVDIACGTAPIYRDLTKSFSNVQYVGIDLSLPYLNTAQKQAPRARWIHANAERLPFDDASIDIVMSIYLFHELPKEARRQVLREAKRVLKPGGLLVIEDAAQARDSHDILGALENFYRDFHEPFFAHYLNDPLEDIVSACGFEQVENETHFVSKVISARLAESAL